MNFKLFIVCFLLTSSNVFSQAVLLPAKLEYFNFASTPVVVIKGVVEIEFDSLKSELKSQNFKGKSIEFFSVLRNNETWWVRASTVRKLYSAQEPKTGGYDAGVSNYESSATQCTANTKSGRRCKRMTNSLSGKCWQHE